MTHDELVTRAIAWLNRRCEVVLREYHCWGPEIPDALGFRRDYTMLVECKTSRSDFKHDGRKECRNRGINHLGNYRYYLVPNGLIRPDEVPDGWGLLYAKPKTIRIAVRAPVHGEAEIRAEEHHILYSLVRRATIRGYLPSLTQPENTVKEVMST